MATPAANVVKIDWKQVCPWIVLFRTFGLAFHFRQILVGTVAAGLISLVYSLVLDASGNEFDPTLSWRSGGIILAPLAPVMDLVSPLWAVGQSTSVANSGSGTVSASNPVLSWNRFGSWLLLLASTILIGGLAGGILTRRAAFEFAREESVSLWQTFRYVGKRSIDYLSAPLLPLCAVLAIGFTGVLTGWLVRGIPTASGGLAVIWIVPLTFGILMACLLFAIYAGWPMMVAAVSINGGDGFDGLSRGFGFVVDRWRYYAWCTLLLLAYGNVAWLIVLTALSWGDSLANVSISLGLASTPDESLTFLSPDNPWYWPIRWLLKGFAYSYFWSGMTLTYLLLRKSVDNAELSDVFLDQDTTEPDALAALLNKNPAPEAPTLLPIITLP